MMARALLFGIITPLLILLSNQLFAQPANDNCSNAELLSIPSSNFGLSTVQSTTINLRGATVQSGEWFDQVLNDNGINQRSVWFRFTIPTIRGLRVTLDQPSTNSPQIGALNNVGLAVYRVSAFPGGCLPGSAEKTASFLTTINSMGNTYNPCVMPGEYLVQVTAKSESQFDSDGFTAQNIFIKVETTNPGTPNDYNLTNNAYNFGTVSGSSGASVEYSLGCYSVDVNDLDNSSGCTDLGGSEYKDYTQSSWHIFSTDAFVDYVRVEFSKPDQTPCSNFRLGYNLYRGNVRTGGTSALTRVDGCKVVTQSSNTNIDYLCVLDPNTTYSIQLFFHKDYANTASCGHEDIRVRIREIGAGQTVAPIVAGPPKVPAAHQINPLASSTSGTTTTLNDVWACNARMSVNSCPDVKPSAGVTHSSVTYDLNDWVIFTTDKILNVTINTTFNCMQNFNRLYSGNVNSSCNLTLYSDDNGNAQWVGGSRSFTCLPAGTYSLQVMQQVMSTTTGSDYFNDCHSALGRSFSIQITGTDVLQYNQFALRNLTSPAQADLVNGGTLDPMSITAMPNNNTYVNSTEDKFGCGTTVLPSDNCSLTPTKNRAMYRMFRIPDNNWGILEIDQLNSNLSYRLYSGNAFSLRASQGKYSGGETFTGLTPLTSCQNGGSFRLCVGPGVHTFVTYGDNDDVNRTDRPRFRFKQYEEMFDLDDATRIDRIHSLNPLVSGTTYTATRDYFDCNPTIMPAGTQTELCKNGSYDHDRAIYRLFYIDRYGVVTIQGTCGNRYRLYRGDVRAIGRFGASSSPFTTTELPRQTECLDGNEGGWYCGGWCFDPFRIDNSLCGTDWSSTTRCNLPDRICVSPGYYTLAAFGTAQDVFGGPWDPNMPKYDEPKITFTAYNNLLSLTASPAQPPSPTAAFNRINNLGVLPNGSSVTSQAGTFDCFQTILPAGPDCKPDASYPAMDRAMYRTFEITGYGVLTISGLGYCPTSCSYHPGFGYRLFRGDARALADANSSGVLGDHSNDVTMTTPAATPGRISGLVDLEGCNCNRTQIKRCMEPGKYTLVTYGYDEMRTFGDQPIFHYQDWNNTFDLQDDNQVFKLDPDGSGPLGPGSPLPTYPHDMSTPQSFGTQSMCFDCRSDIMPDINLCGAVDRSMYRQINISEPGVLFIRNIVGGTRCGGSYNNNPCNIKYRLFRGDAHSLTQSNYGGSPDYNPPFKIPVHSSNPALGLIDVDGCQTTDFSACVVPGVYTLVSMGGNVVDAHITCCDNPSFQFIKRTTQFSNPSSPDNMGTITSDRFGTKDYWTCPDNAANIGTGSNQRTPCTLGSSAATKQIYRTFTIPSNGYAPNDGAFVSIGTTCEFTGSTYSLFVGNSTGGLSSLVPYKDNAECGGSEWTCFTSKSTPACCPLPPGTYTLVTYGNELNVGDSTNIRITLGSPPGVPKYNKPAKAYLASTRNSGSAYSSDPEYPGQQNYCIAGETGDFPTTIRKYVLGTETFTCHQDKPGSYFSFNPGWEVDDMTSDFCNEPTNTYNRVAYYVFEISHESYVRIADIPNTMRTQVYRGNVKTATLPIDFGGSTFPLIQPCIVRDDALYLCSCCRGWYHGEIELCKLQPGFYTIAIFASSQHIGTSITPKLYVEKYRTSKYDFTAHAYDFGLINPAGTHNSEYYSGKGQLRSSVPANTAALSNDYFTCATGAYWNEPGTLHDAITDDDNPHVGSYKVRNQASVPYPMTNNYPIFEKNPGVDTTKVNYSSHGNTWTNQNIRRTLWYTFTLNGGGTAYVRVTPKTPNPTSANGHTPCNAENMYPWKETYYPFAVYESNADGSIDFASLPNSEKDSTYAMGLTLIGRSQVTCDFTGVDNTNEISFSRDNCGVPTKRYYVVVDHDVWKELNGQVEVDIRYNKLPEQIVKYDNCTLDNNSISGLYYGPNIINGLGQTQTPYTAVTLSNGTYTGAQATFRCATKASTDRNTCGNTTLWYKIDISTSGRMYLQYDYKNGPHFHQEGTQYCETDMLLYRYNASGNACEMDGPGSPASTNPMLTRVNLTPEGHFMGCSQWGFTCIQPGTYYIMMTGCINGNQATWDDAWIRPRVHLIHDPVVYDNFADANKITPVQHDAPPYPADRLGVGTYVASWATHACATSHTSDPEYGSAHVYCWPNPGDGHGWVNRHPRTLWYTFDVANNITGKVRINYDRRDDNNNVFTNQYDDIEVKFYRRKPGALSSELPPNSNTGLIPITLSPVTLSGVSWGQSCISPGTYYIMMTGCNIMFDDVRPRVQLEEDRGDFCAAPMTMTLNLPSGYSPTTVTQTLRVDCHTMLPDFGEDGTLMGCLIPDGFTVNDYKTSWFMLDLTTVDKTDLTFKNIESTTASAAQIRYRVLYGTCNAMTQGPCNTNSATEFTMSCLQSGKYYVQLAVPKDATGTDQIEITARPSTDPLCTAINPDRPTALFNFTGSCTNAATIFTNLSTQGSDMTYLWDIDYDGVTFSPEYTVNFPNPTQSHTYTTPGTYNVRLRARNNVNMLTHDFQMPVTISLQPDVSTGITRTPNDNPAKKGDPYNFFSNVSNHTGTTTYSWNFGSGATPTTSTDRNPTNVVFENIGATTVTLTVCNGACCRTVTHTFNVIPDTIANKYECTNNTTTITVTPKPDLLMYWTTVGPNSFPAYINETITYESVTQDCPTELPPANWTASVNSADAYKASWCDEEEEFYFDDTGNPEWLQVDLGQPKPITRTSLRKDWFGGYIQTYQLQYSLNGTTWETYKENSSVVTITGNSHMNDLDVYNLKEPFIARYVRLYPITYVAFPMPFPKYGGDWDLFTSPELNANTNSTLQLNISSTPRQFVLNILRTPFTSFAFRDTFVAQRLIDWTPLADVTVCTTAPATIPSSNPPCTGCVFSWAPATWLSATNVQNPTVSPTGPGTVTYTITITHPLLPSCSVTDEVVYTVINPVVDVPNQIFCQLDAPATTDITTTSQAGYKKYWIPKGNNAFPDIIAEPITYVSLTQTCPTRLPDANWSASSYSSNAWLANFCDDHWSSYWSPAPGMPPSIHWIAIDLGEAKPVTQTILTGGHPMGGLVTSYKLEYSENGSTWMTYKENGVDKIIPGISSFSDISTYTLKEPFIARYVKLRFETMSVFHHMPFVNWDLMTSPQLHHDSNPTLTVHVTTAGNRVELVAVNPLCSASGYYRDEVLIQNQLQWTGLADKSVCTLDPTTFTNPNPACGTCTYSWSPADWLSATNIPNPTVTPGGMGQSRTYTITITNTANGCQIQDVVTFSVAGTISASIVASNGGVACPGSGVQLTASLTGAGIATISWSPATGLSATNIHNPIATPPTTTTYTATITPNISGCPNYTATQTVTVSPGPAWTPLADKVTCSMSSTTFTNPNTPCSGCTYLWSPSTWLSSATVINPTITPTSSGIVTYTVTISSPSFTCPTTDEVSFTVIGQGAIPDVADRLFCDDFSATSTQIVTANQTGIQKFWMPWDFPNSIHEPVTYVSVSTPDCMMGRLPAANWTDHTGANPSACNGDWCNSPFPVFWTFNYMMDPGPYWLQVDLGSPKIITRSRTVGNGNMMMPQYITQYQLEYSLNGSSWTIYTEGGTPRTFNANTDPFNIVARDIKEPFIARYVRLRVINYVGDMMMTSGTDWDLMTSPQLDANTNPDLEVKVGTTPSYFVLAGVADLCPTSIFHRDTIMVKKYNQAPEDWQTKKHGNWNDCSIWQVHDVVLNRWVDASAFSQCRDLCFPTSRNRKITVKHSVVYNLQDLGTNRDYETYGIDQTIIEPTGTVRIPCGRTMNIRDTLASQPPHSFWGAPYKNDYCSGDVINYGTIIVEGQMIKRGAGLLINEDNSLVHYRRRDTMPCTKHQFMWNGNYAKLWIEGNDTSYHKYLTGWDTVRQELRFLNSKLVLRKQNLKLLPGVTIPTAPSTGYPSQTTGYVVANDEGYLDWEYSRMTGAQQRHFPIGGHYYSPAVFRFVNVTGNYSETTHFGMVAPSWKPAHPKPYQHGGSLYGRVRELVHNYDNMVIGRFWTFTPNKAYKFDYQETTPGNTFYAIPKPLTFNASDKYWGDFHYVDADLRFPSEPENKQVGVGVVYSSDYVEPSNWRRSAPMTSYPTSVGLANNIAANVGSIQNNAFSDFTFRFTDTPLASEQFLMLNGTWQNRTAKLNWTDNNQSLKISYDLARSTDAKTFETIETINFTSNNTNSGAPIALEHLDKQTESIDSDVFYYKIKATDYDGQVYHSNMVQLSRNAKTSLYDDVIVYPNPVQEHASLNVRFYLNSDDVTTITLYDAVGKKIINEQKSLKSGEQSVDIPTVNVTKGTYLLQIMTNGRILSKKIAVY